MASIPFSLARDGRKVCSKCLAEKPISDFYPDARKADGLRPRCKECFKSGPKRRPYGTFSSQSPEYKRAWNRKNAERLLASGKRKRPYQTREQLAQSAKGKREAAEIRSNAIACARAAWIDWLARAPEWWLERRDAVLAELKRERLSVERQRYQDHRSADPERLRSAWRKAKHLRRLRRKDQSDGTLQREDFDLLYREAKTCIYCACKLTRRTPDEWRATDATLDHLNPLSGGGVHGHVNVVICCASCNFSKHDRALAEWLTELRPERAAAVRRLYKRRYGVPVEQRAML